MYEDIVAQLYNAIQLRGGTEECSVNLLSHYGKMP